MRLFACLLLTLVNWHLAGETRETASTQDIRTIETSRGTSIASQLRPEDQHVQVKRGDIISSFIGSATSDLTEDLDERATNADVIAVVEPTRTDSFLVENGEWIRSRVTLRVVRVIKEQMPPRFDLSGHISFDHDGGELLVDSVRVRAGYFYWFRNNERYLVFLKSLGPGRNGLVGLPFRVTTENRLAPMDMSTGRKVTADSPMYDLQLDDVVAQLRRRLQPKE